MKETVVSFLLLGPMISIAAGQSLPTKKEAELFLQKAGKAADLRANDTPPFHLVATVHYTIGPQPSTADTNCCGHRPINFAKTSEWALRESKKSP
jgi:hypothetical protein